jgi:predicted nucleotidyltransferase
MKKTLLAAILILNGLIFSQTFTEINSVFALGSFNSAEWGDYDNDGDLDILINVNIFNNDSGVFTRIYPGLTSVSEGSVTWGDYDNDGDLDIILTGKSSSGLISRIYRNDGGVFTDINAELTGVFKSSAAWGDYDNDGDLDVLITGDSGSGFISKIYRNDGGVFTDINVELIGVNDSSVAWGDIDNDGDLDVLITGHTGSTAISKIYVNNNGSFIESTSELPGIYRGSAVFSDIDNDGDLDLILSGLSENGSVSRIYKNTSGLFIFSSYLSDNCPAYDCSISCADSDNDGDIDILITGYTGYDCVYKFYLYKNNGSGTFTTNNMGFQGVSRGFAGWGDYDNDGDMDIGLYGWYSELEEQEHGGGYIEQFHTKSALYINESVISNTPPQPPANLTSQVDNNKVSLSWDKAVDIETPQDGLSYNIYIGTTSGNGDILDPMSDIDTGYRKIVRLGNSGQTNFSIIQDLPNGIYFWSVQAIDNAYKGSNFAEEGSFEINVTTVPEPPLALTSENTTVRSFIAKWQQSDYATGYNIDVATDSSFTNLMNDYNNLNVFKQTCFQVDSLDPGTAYYYRIRSYNVVGESENSNIIKTRTLDNPFIGVSSEIIGVYNSSSAACDYDNDGDLDILLTGHTGSTYISKIYRNDNGTFTNINAGLTGIEYGSVAWGDYDNDGDLDILLTGHTGSNYISRIYRNDNGSFTDINAGLTGVSFSSVAWGDYDNDGDLDILITGIPQISDIYRNNGNGSFTNINAGLPGVKYSSVAWGDYDNDGDLDILLTGETVSTYISRIYRNDNRSFNDINAGLTGVVNSSVAWGDYDNDGQPDILLTGVDALNNRISKIYRNDNGSFLDIKSELIDVSASSISLGDFNNDGSLDIFLSGTTGSENISKLFLNASSISNSKPSDPTNLSAIQNGSSLEFSWDKATDAETQQNGLSYNLYIGTESGKCNIVSPLSDFNSGYRKVVALGNAQQNTSWTIKDLPPGTYYWSVQAIDHSYAGSEFATEQTITVTSIEDELIPLVTKLYQNYPNPFNPATEIRFSLAEDSKVNLSIYNTNGQLVRTMLDGKTEKGYHTVNFDASELNSGMYLYRLDVNGNVQTKKMLMLK